LQDEHRVEDHRVDKLDAGGSLKDAALAIDLIEKWVDSLNTL